jgi:hypothetical protein
VYQLSNHRPNHHGHQNVYRKILFFLTHCYCNYTAIRWENGMYIGGFTGEKIVVGLLR